MERSTNIDQSQLFIDRTQVSTVSNITMMSWEMPSCISPIRMALVALILILTRSRITIGFEGKQYMYTHRFDSLEWKGKVMYECD